jgi:hypothetical protein
MNQNTRDVGIAPAAFVRMLMYESRYFSGV